MHVIACNEIYYIVLQFHYMLLLVRRGGFADVSAHPPIEMRLRIAYRISQTRNVELGISIGYSWDTFQVFLKSYSSDIPGTRITRDIQGYSKNPKLVQGVGFPDGVPSQFKFRPLRVLEHWPPGGGPGAG